MTFIAKNDILLSVLVRDCLANLELQIPDEFAVSNEVWPDSALSLVSSASGDAAAIVGSGNAPNILPLISGLERVAFMDISAGHGAVFRAKLNAVRSAGSLAHNLGARFAGVLLSEAGLFDMVRENPDNILHFTRNEQSRDAFAGLAEELVITDKNLNILDDMKAPEINKGAEKLAWLHLSNVVPYCVERGAKDVERKLFGFIDDMPGVDDDTVVTFSRRTDIELGNGVFGRRLQVVAKRLDDIVFGDLLNDDSITFSQEGGVIVRKIA